ncbi:Rv1733c family protein [Streptomyces massasporeus]|uniref:Rv1733c family protein n=1 Tax=Streptomyces massasporeus TaxID=67324 RepID=UPI00367B8A8A
MNAQGWPYAAGPPPSRREPSPKGTNPLIRPSDRFETWIRRFLMLVLVLGLPVAAISAGLTAYESSMRTVQTQSAERHEVTARLVSNAKGVTADGKQRAQVRWTDDDGTVRTATTLRTEGTPEGATVRVWVDRNGAITGPPMNTLTARTNGWFVGGMAAIGVTGGFFAARAGTHRVLNRRRYARWAAEWDLVEPVWSARFRR